jgi:sulfur carrier protein ThiS adenylyltransferase
MTHVSVRALDPVPFDDDAAVRERLAASHVAVIGCGGLGSNAAAMLLRSGVGTLTLVDFDVVEESNLNRQLFFADQLGEPKAQALSSTLRRICDNADLRVHQACVTEDNITALVADADVVIEAVDRAETKAMIVNTLLARHPEIPLVAASGLAGFASANEVVCQQVGEDFYLVGDLESDVRRQLPLIASRVMVAAAHEAHMAIRILLGHPTP